ncbi:FAS-associated death domain protein [Merluccius polli]|uniref:FAS-associated death domain protein n=1 Tax=Merluccius polli TaxID=89951 RepID=A0AA47M2E5_MERPO|nr:FAS-associated death domain protein [Merluccius polli]
MKYVCPSIGKKQKEDIKNGYQLFEVLMERNLLAADNTDLLKKLLTDAGRLDLADKLTQFGTRTRNSDPGPNEPNHSERVRIDVATDVMADNVGKNWRKLARKLGLSEVKLQSIDQKRLDLEETTREVVREWRTAQGSEASVDQLVVALKECGQLLTAEKVQDAIQKDKNINSHH